jgi:hypothetical protein
VPARYSCGAAPRPGATHERAWVRPAVASPRVRYRDPAVTAQKRCSRSVRALDAGADRRCAAAFWLAESEKRVEGSGEGAFGALASGLAGKNAVSAAAVAGA